MFKKTQTEPTELENAITDLFDAMADVSGDSDEYARMVAQMDTLYKLKEVDQKAKSKKIAWAEIWVPAAASVIGVLLITGHEKTNVITSKALNFIPKLH